MIINVEISEETWARMLTGRRVEGTIGYDLTTRRKDFHAFNRHRTRSRLRDRLIAKTPWGWVKQSLERKKRFTSIPSELPLEQKLQILDEENALAKQALIDQELDLIAFC